MTVMTQPEEPDRNMKTTFGKNTSEHHTGRGPKRFRRGVLPALVLGYLVTSPQTARPLWSFTLLASPPGHSSSGHSKKTAHEKPDDSLAVIWREPADIATRDLFYGPGGKDHQPSGNFSFIQEKLRGTNPKFDVRDESGIRWGVKMGGEAGPETAATRLIWAVGYFANEDYYLPELNVGRDLALTRGRALIDQGRIHGVRLKRHNKGEHIIANWSWDKNPFVGTKELDGLKIMMEIICNTDLKPEQQHVYDIDGAEQRYIAADVGMSFGKAGRTILRTKGNLKDYRALPLIKHAGPEFIDFWYFKHIPREHARWIGSYLARLSDKQISDAFRAAGFTPAEVDGFATKVREKINELKSLN